MANLAVNDDMGLGSAPEVFYNALSHKKNLDMIID